MTQPAYMQEPWFQVLKEACERASKSEVARQLGTSQPLVCQVTNGTGLYGTGKASTANFAKKVEAVLGKFECPYLTELMGSPRVIDVNKCRSFAHRPVPNNATAIEHWKECRKCPKFALTAPPPPEPPVPKKRRKTAPTTSPLKSTTKESTS